MQFNVTFSSEICSDTLDGRLLLISTDAEDEPRFQITDGRTPSLSLVLT